MYPSIFLGLNEAATQIARQLVSSYPARYPDKAAALDSARRELVNALFDGAVHSEGVPIPRDPGPDDPNERPQPPKPDQWEPIAAGWWSSERYEPYVVSTTDFELHLLGLARPPEQALNDPKFQQVIKGAYLLYLTIQGWCGDTFELIGFEEQGYSRIRVPRTDINDHFLVEKLMSDHDASKQSADPTPIANTEQDDATGTVRKLVTKPPRVRKEVLGWLEKYLQDRGPDWIRTRTNPWLAREYSKNVPNIGDLDYVRSLIAAWRRQRGLSRPFRSTR